MVGGTRLGPTTASALATASIRVYVKGRIAQACSICVLARLMAASPASPSTVVTGSRTASARVRHESTRCRPASTVQAPPVDDVWHQRHRSVGAAVRVTTVKPPPWARATQFLRQFDVHHA